MGENVTFLYELPKCDPENHVHPIYTRNTTTGVCRCDQCGAGWVEEPTPAPDWQSIAEDLARGLANYYGWVEMGELLDTPAALLALDRFRAAGGVL